MPELFIAAIDRLSVLYDKARPFHAMSRRRAAYVARKELGEWERILEPDFGSSESAKGRETVTVTKETRGYQTAKVSYSVNRRIKPTDFNLHISAELPFFGTGDFLTSGRITYVEHRKRGLGGFSVTVLHKTNRDAKLTDWEDSDKTLNTPFARAALRKFRLQLK